MQKSIVFFVKKVYNNAIHLLTYAPKNNIIGMYMS